jgi:hypothetical protein
MGKFSNSAGEKFPFEGRLHPVRRAVGPNPHL